MEIVQKVLEFLLAVLFMGLGGLLLLAGRKYIWLLLGGGGFLIAAALIAVVLGQDNGWNLAQEQMWIPLLIALLAGVLGIFIAQNYDRLAADIIGFAAGVYIVTWFDQILLYLDNRA